jgi:hypothetical protein
VRAGWLRAWLAIASAPLLLAAQPAEKPAPDAAKAAAAEERPNGFDLANARVPRESIVAGGPPRDGIRSVDAPGFSPPQEASWVGPLSILVGLEVGGDARGYPVHLLEYHQVVNDVVGGVPVAVAYDPLTGAARAFRREVDGRRLEFGVSGLLYNSSFLLHDRETSSLWLHWTGEALAGPLAGRRLERLRVRQEIRDIWLTRQPGSRILARPDPRHIDYRYSPFEKYWVSDEIPYPVKARDPRYHAKELVLGVLIEGRARAYLGSLLTAADKHVVEEVSGRRIEVHYESEAAAFVWEAPPDVDVSEAYWFAWKAFHPDTEVWKPEEKQAP